MTDQPVPAVLGDLDLQETGSIDFVIIDFAGQELHAELLPYLLELVDQRIIRVMDVLFVRKQGDGTVESFTTNDLDDPGELAGASSGLFTTDDVTEAGELLEPNTTAVMVLYENLWSLPFAKAARQSGGKLVSHGHIPTQAIAAVLDDLDATGA